MTAQVHSLMIGNFAIDCQEHPCKTEELLGGAGYRFALGWALFGLPLYVCTVIGSEAVWNKSIEVLKDNLINFSGSQFVTSSLRFRTCYDDQLAINNFETQNQQIMQMTFGLGKRASFEDYSLVHVCPFQGLEQLELIERFDDGKRQISSMIHYSSLNERTRPYYLRILPHLDYLFVNEFEARFLLENNDLGRRRLGEELSSDLRGWLFITFAEDGSAIYRNGRFVAYCPAAKLNVSNILGAGDHFVGGALAGWMIYENPIMALRCGSYASSFAIAGCSHSALINFLDNTQSNILDHADDRIEYKSTYVHRV